MDDLKGIEKELEDDGVLEVIHGLPLRPVSVEYSPEFFRNYMIVYKVGGKDVIISRDKFIFEILERDAAGASRPVFDSAKVPGAEARCMALKRAFKLAS